MMDSLFGATNIGLTFTFTGRPVEVHFSEGAG